MAETADRSLAARPRAVLQSPWLWVGLVYACGLVVRAIYTFRVQPPERFITSDMLFYVSVAQKLVAAHGAVDPWDVTRPLGYPALLAFLISGGGSLARVATVQMFVSALVPPAVGVLAAAAYGRRTAQLAVVFATLYFPFIEYGALFLSEIHFILWLTLSFAVLLAVHHARRQAVALALAAAGGVLLSVAAAFKSVALPAAFLLAAVEATALLVGLPRADLATRMKRLRPWLLRWAVVSIAAAPLLAVQAVACTRANAGNFCVTSNEIGPDFLLGHYGRIGALEWTAPDGATARMDSPGSYLRRYDTTARVPFEIGDGAANVRAAWRWIVAHPGEAIVLSIDHVYDTFFGPAMWPGYTQPSWMLAHLSQYVFIALLFIPLLPACAAIVRRGARAVATSRTALVLAPVAALTITVAFATGEVRYRIPFDVFMMIVVCGYVSGDLRRLDLAPASTQTERRA